MIAIPAIDLRDGACVQLVGGSFADERIRLTDPVAVAERWRALGFARLHVVDLDAAMGTGSNAGVVGSILDARQLAVHVGGGVRSERDIARWLDRGAARVVVGTKGVQDPHWLDTQARRWPNRVVLALDVRDGRVQVHGWSADADNTLDTLLALVANVPLGGLLVTCVDVEGRMQGPNLDLMRDVRAATRHSIAAAGGITSVNDLASLDAIGIEAAVIGMALYTGTLDAAEAARRFAA